MNVEIIIWHDAAKTDRDKFTEDPMIMGTIGIVFRENRKMIYLLHEWENNKDYAAADADLDYTEIPRKMIVQRMVVGEVSLPIEVKRARRRVKNGEEVGRNRVAEVPPSTVLPSKQ